MKKIISMLAALILVLAGCSSGGNTDEVFVKATTEPEGLDIKDASYSQTFAIYSDLYSGIYKINDLGELELSGASDVTFNKENLTYTIKLRDDMKWVDSTGAEKGAVTANDYVWTYNRIVDVAKPGLMAYLFEPFKGYKEVMIDKSAETGSLGVKAVDDTTLEIQLAYEVPYFESMLAFPAFYPQSQKAFEEHGESFSTTADTAWYNGPFYATAYDMTSEIVTSKNTLYYNAEKVQLEGVKYKVVEDETTAVQAFKNGEIDYTAITDPTVYSEGISDKSVQDKLTGYTFYLSLNKDEGHSTSDKLLSEALAKGFDRATILTTAMGEINKPVEHMILKDITPVAYDGLEYKDYAQDSYGTYDLEGAKAALDKYMKQENITDSSLITLQYLSNDASASKRVAEAIQANYSQNLGITIEVVEMQGNAYYDARNAGEFDLVNGGWGPDYADPSTYLSIFNSAYIGTMNTSRYNNPEFDKQLNSSALITDPVKRMQEYAKLEKMLLEDYAVVPFYQKNEPYMIKQTYKVPSHLFLKISNEYTTLEAE